MDNKKQSFTIPKFVYALAGILLVCIIFLFAVQMPFSGKIDKYNKDHESATSQINMYKDYLERAAEVQESINQMRAYCEEMNEKLTINGSKTIDDVRDMLKNLDYDLTTLVVTEGKADSKGRVSATGDPLYVTSIKFTFTSTEKKLIETLKYFESESEGSYYISKMAVQEEQKKAVATTESGAVEGSQQSVNGADKLYVTNLEISLYFFDMSKNKNANMSDVSVGSGASSSTASSK